MAFKISEKYCTIDEKFIPNALSFSIEHDEIETIGISDVPTNHIALMHNCLDDQTIKEIKTATQTTPIKGLVSIDLCGTHL